MELAPAIQYNPLEETHPDRLAACGDKSELRHVDLDNGALG